MREGRCGIAAAIIQNSAVRESMISQGNFTAVYVEILFTELSGKGRMERLQNGNAVITFRTAEKKSPYREIR